MSGLVEALENHTQKLLHLARDFLADGFDLFFPGVTGCLRPAVPGRFFR
jgi:hypothetical protein